MNTLTRYTKLDVVEGLFDHKQYLYTLAQHTAPDDVDEHEFADFLDHLRSVCLLEVKEEEEEEEEEGGGVLVWCVAILGLLIGVTTAVLGLTLIVAPPVGVPVWESILIGTGLVVGGIWFARGP